MKQEYIAASKELVEDAIQQHDIDMSETLQAHVVFVLSRYFDRPFSELSVTMKYFKGVHHDHDERRFVNIGDHCLMLTSYFRERAKKMASIDYYTTIGKSSYDNARLTEQAYGFELMRDVINVATGKYTNKIEFLLEEANNDSPFAKKQISLMNIIPGPWHK